MADQEQDRSEPATPHKQREARKRGQVAKSLELSSLVALGTLLLVMLGWARSLLERQFRLDAGLLAQAGAIKFDVSTLTALFTRLTHESLSLLMPLFLPLLALAILGGLLQSGPTFSFHPLKPDIDRINPVAGFKRLFSMKLLFESGKTVVKLLLFGLALWLLAGALLGSLLGLVHVSPVGLFGELLSAATALIFKLLLVLAVVMVADMAYTRWSFQNQLKMSRREVREELKSQEGDPRIRSRLRDLRREMLKRTKAVARVPEADVLITNPTHLAVAVLYRREDMAAPQVIAKGSGELAAHMRELARRHRVPVVESPTLARALFAAGEVDQPVPGRLYPPLARLLVWVYALRERRAAGA